jgi:hypothetical protein
VLTAGSPPASAWEFHGFEIPDRFSYHQVPYPCQSETDCCDGCTCESGQCYFTEYVPLFLDYTSRSSSQGNSGQCTWYAPFHAFQTLNAFKQDALFADPGSGGFEWPWHVLGRGIRLSMSPQFQCSIWAGSVGFLLGAGTVESCVEGSETYDNTPANECGHHDRYRTQVIDSSYPSFNQCSRIQRQSQQVLAYQPTGSRWIEDVRWELHDYCGLFDPSCMFINSRAGQYYLAKTLLERGPFWTNVRWGGVFVPGTPDFEVQCDLSDLTYAGHQVAVIGYDFSDPDAPYFFIQNSHNTDADKKVYKINFEAWAPDCWFGDSIGYWEGVPFYPAEALLGPGSQPDFFVSEPRLAFDELRGRLIVAGSGTRGAPELWALLPKHARWEEQVVALPKDLAGFELVADALRHRMFLVGGTRSGVDTAEIWQVGMTSGDVRLAPATAPVGLARSRAAVALDPSGRKLYLFGGRAGGEVLGDLWSLDLETWTWQGLSSGPAESAPAARERGAIILEPQFERLWVAGGRDATGPLPPVDHMFSLTGLAWQERRPLTADGTGRLTGTIGPDDEVTVPVEIADTVAYPGQPTLVTVDSPEPCLGLRVRDSHGELTAHLACQDGERGLAFVGQPGERYTVELVPLHGFDRGSRPEYVVEVRDAELTPAGEVALAHRAKALAVDHRTGGDLGVVLAGSDLQIVDLADPVHPAPVATVPVGALALDVALAGGAAVVTGMGPPAESLRRFDLRNPAVPVETGLATVPGLGRRVATWGGKAYVEGLTRVHVVSLAGANSPQVIDTIETGGLITALAARDGRLAVAVGKKLQLYEVRATASPLLLAEVPLDRYGAAILLQGEVVQVAEMGLGEILKCVLGVACTRTGVVEAFRMDGAGGLTLAGTYPANARSVPYLRWSGRHAYAMEGKKLTVLAAGAIQ